MIEESSRREVLRCRMAEALGELTGYDEVNLAESHHGHALSSEKQYISYLPASISYWNSLLFLKLKYEEIMQKIEAHKLSLF